MSIHFLHWYISYEKYRSICKTITFTSYPSAETKLLVFLLSQHVLRSLYSVLCFSTFYCFISKSISPHRHHFTWTIIHAMGTPVMTLQNCF